MVDTAKTEMRVILGFAVQPLVCALVAFMSFPILEYTGRSLYGGRPADALDSAIAVAIGTGLVGFFVTIVAAVPSYLWVRSRGLLSRGVVLWCGVILGNLPSLLIVVLLAINRAQQGQAANFDALTYGVAGAIRAIAFGSFIGAAGAAVFWWIAGRRVSADWSG